MKYIILILAVTAVLVACAPLLITEGEKVVEEIAEEVVEDIIIYEIEKHQTKE